MNKWFNYFPLTSDNDISRVIPLKVPMHLVGLHIPTYPTPFNHLNSLITA